MKESPDQSSFREMYHYPNDGYVQKNRKYALKGQKNKRQTKESNQPQKQTFFDVVQKAKNVALFTRNLKQRIAENRTLNTHTLKSNQLQYLESDAQDEYMVACFNHDNKIILGIEVIYITTMLMYFWQCTFEIVFGELSTNQIINGIALLFYVIHIILFQLTEYKNQKSELISDTNQIREIYFNSKMIKDAISIVVILLQLTPLDDYQDITPLFMILRVLSLLSFFEMRLTFQKVENQLVRSMETQTYVSLLKLLFKLFLFLHLLSSALNLMATIERSLNIPITWLDNSNISYGTHFDKYILGWYWGATIFSTVGFGEIIPANNVQRFLVSFLELFCCLTFGYYINAIGQIIKVRAESSEKYERQVRKVNRYLNQLVLSNDLKHKIRTHYFNKNLIEQQHDPSQEKEVLSTITPNLKASLLEQINMKIVKNCNVLESFKGEIIKNISESIKRTILAPEYILYSRNTTERKLWFIENGTIEEQTDIFPSSTLRKIISVYGQKNPLVGWINFLLPGSYQTIARAKNFTIAHEIQENQFMKCLESEVGQYHKYLEMKHRMLEKNKKFENKCISCGRYTHNVVNCPRIHLVKKQGVKIIQQKNDLIRYRSSIRKNCERTQLRYHWKYIFGNKQLEKEAFMLNNGNQFGYGTIENYLKKLGNKRESLVQTSPGQNHGIMNDSGKRKGSVMMIMVPKQFKNEAAQLRQTNPNKNELNDRSMMSFESDDQERGIEFEKAFYNKEFKTYMPHNDIEEIMLEYSKKMMKKKLGGSSKQIISHK